MALELGEANGALVGLLFLLFGHIQRSAEVELVRKVVRGDVHSRGLQLRQVLLLERAHGRIENLRRREHLRTDLRSGSDQSCYGKNPTVVHIQPPWIGPADRRQREYRQPTRRYRTCSTCVRRAASQPTYPAPARRAK